MKVTPIAQGSGVPGAQTNAQVGGQQQTSPERKAMALAKALGQMDVSQSDTPIDPELYKQTQNVRRITMRTNRSTNRPIDPAPQIPQVEPAAPTQEQTQPVVEATQPISPQFAALARQRRALQVKESEIAARERALADSQPQTDLVAKLKADPLSVLQEAGVSYDDLTQAILNNQSGINPEVQALKAKIDALEKGLDTKLSERDQQAEQQVLGEMRKQINQMTAQGDEYEMIRATKSQPDVVKLIHEVWKKSGEVLDVDEAAKLVEDDLLEQVLSVAKVGKVQSKLTPLQQAVVQAQPQRQQMRTITNRDAARPVLDRRARAIAAAMDTLKT